MYFNKDKSLNASSLNYLSLNSSQELMKSKPNYFSMWYVDDETTQITDLTEVNKENLLIATNLDFVVRVLYKNGLRIKNYEGKSGYDAIYHIFKNGSLLYYFPSPNYYYQADSFNMMELNKECFGMSGKVLFFS